MNGNTGEHVEAFSYDEVKAGDDIDAFDRLPPLTRRVLSRCAFRINCQRVLASISSVPADVPIHLVDREAARQLIEGDQEMIASAYRERGVDI